MDGKQNKIVELERLTVAPDFWQNQNKAKAVSKELNDLKQEVEDWDKLLAEVRSVEEIAAVAAAENDLTLVDDLTKQYEQLASQTDKWEFLILFNGPYDQSGAILSIHAGTGGFRRR